MAATDRMAPEAGEGVILVLAVPGQRPFAHQKGEDLRRGDLVAGCISVGISEEVAQDVRSSCELRAVGLGEVLNLLGIWRGASFA